MMQANYSPDNIGHFGLAYDEYSHFTSPIRRYPDLMLHRAIKSKVTNSTQPVMDFSLEGAGLQTSDTERRAEKASRYVESWLKCHYMKDHVGEEFDGVVTTVTNFGLFITLTDLYIDGLVHISNVGDDFFVYDEQQQQLIGKDRGTVFGLGDSVKVKVASVNMDLLQIDFELKSKLQSSKMNQTKKDHSNRSQSNQSATNKDQPKKSPAKKSGSRGGRGSSKKS
jgi:ribonuclease R